MIPRLTCSLGQHGRVQKSLVLETGKAEYNPCHGQANALVSSHVFLCDTHRREKTICPGGPFPPLLQQEASSVVSWLREEEADAGD